MEPGGEKVLAVDLALIPPDWVQQRARAINAALLAEQPDGFCFDASHLPHISLVQLFIRRAKLLSLVQCFDSALAGVLPFPLRVLRSVSHQSSVSFLLESTPHLLLLHSRLMDLAKAMEESSGTEAAFFSDTEPADDRDAAWVARYRSHSSYAHFVPHLTLGMGTAPEQGEPFDFIVDRVGLFRLGRFCTCRLPLHQWQL